MFTKDILCQFIVVCDKSTEDAAHSIYNRAAKKGIKSVVWMEKDFEANKSRLTNRNHVLFLNEKYTNKYLADPTLESMKIIDGVFYKKQGNQLGIYIDTQNLSRIEKMIGGGGGVLISIGGVLSYDSDSYARQHLPSYPGRTKGLVKEWLGGACLAVGSVALMSAKIMRDKRRYKMLMKAVDKFDKDFLLDYVQDKQK